MNHSKYFFALIALLAFSFGHAADITHTLSSSIRSVTVYQVGAQVERSAQKRLRPGKHTLVFSDLSPQINPQTIQAGGEGAFSILSVSHRHNYLKPELTTARQNMINDSLELLKMEKKASEGLVWVLNEEKSMILENKKMVEEDGNSNNTLELEKRANFFRSQLLGIIKKIHQEERKMVIISKKINRLHQQLKEEVRSGKRVGEVVLEIDVEKESQLKIRINYLVNSAGWIPIYDLRAKGTNEPIVLNYKAQVYQSSGISWEGVDLSLSTANPYESTQKPSVNVWTLHFQNQLKAYNASGYLQRIPSNRKERAKSSSESYDDEEVLANTEAGSVTMSSNDLAYQPRLFGANAKAQMRRQAANFFFEIPTKYDIPSDGKHHLVSIRSTKIDAHFKHYSAPKYQKKAYLLARIPDWNKFELLPGEANLYFENTYIGKSQLNTQATSDTLDISLGQDKGLVVERNKIADFCSSKVLGSNKKETLGLEIKIRNTKTHSVSCLVEDQIPVSGNSEIEVELIESGKASYDEKSGKLKWFITLNAGETKTMKFQYSVKYPKDKRVNL